MEQFNILSVIGRGYYGKVMLCQSKATGERFAIKAVRKDMLLKSKKVHTVIPERRILEFAIRCLPPFCIPDAFQVLPGPRVRPGRRSLPADVERRGSDNLL
jgi:serine/threonine protein kinase